MNVPVGPAEGNGSAITTVDVDRVEGFNVGNGLDTAGGVTAAATDTDAEVAAGVVLIAGDVGVDDPNGSLLPSDDVADPVGALPLPVLLLTLAELLGGPLEDPLLGATKIKSHDRKTYINMRLLVHTPENGNRRTRGWTRG